jgi:hypothetical protein
MSNKNNKEKKQQYELLMAFKIQNISAEGFYNIAKAFGWTDEEEARGVAILLASYRSHRRAYKDELCESAKWLALKRFGALNIQASKYRKYFIHKAKLIENV